MKLEDFLSPAALENADKDFHEKEALFEKRVAETTAKRLANNLAIFGEPSNA